MDAVQDCLRDRLRLQHANILTHSLTILVTYGWGKGEDGSFAHEALESLSTRFRVPLEKAGVDCSLIQEEWEDIIDYAKIWSRTTLSSGGSSSMLRMPANGKTCWHLLRCFSVFH